jgi:hypothetical protein
MEKEEHRAGRNVPALEATDRRMPSGVSLRRFASPAKPWTVLPAIFASVALQLHVRVDHDNRARLAGDSMATKLFALRILPLLAAIVPLFIIFRIVSTALYAIPETDDFCLANHYVHDGMFGTIAIYYKTLMGRVVSLALVTLPAVISKSIDIDYYVVYPLLLAFYLLGFVGAAIFAAGRLWPEASGAERILAGTALSAVIFVLAVSPHEMFYWLSGAAPYMAPAIIVMIVLVELVRSAASETDLSFARTGFLAVLCLLASTANEFTPLWLIGIISASLLFRRLTSHPHPQVSGHIAMLVVTLIGLIIVILAPGNFVRFGYYPNGGRFFWSFYGAARYLLVELWWLLTATATWGWLMFVVIFSAFVAPATLNGRNRILLLAAGLAVLVMGCAYVGHYVGYYATGEALAMRGRNEVIVLLMVGSACVVALFVTAFNSAIVARFGDPRRRLAYVAALVFCGIALLPLLNGRAWVAVSAQRHEFKTFWLESLQRHAFLSLTKEQNVVVQDRTVKPSVLMSADLHQDPGRLPNDCVAIFYRKKSVILQPGS